MIGKSSIKAAEAPWRLVLVTALQALENLSDRQPAETARGRLDWEYALSLPLDADGKEPAKVPRQQPTLS
jgi:hypothetical protein